MELSLSKKNKYFYFIIFILFVFSCIIFIMQFASAGPTTCDCIGDSEDYSCGAIGCTDPNWRIDPGSDCGYLQPDNSCAGGVGCWCEQITCYSTYAACAAVNAGSIGCVGKYGIQDCYYDGAGCYNFEYRSCGYRTCDPAPICTGTALVWHIDSCRRECNEGACGSCSCGAVTDTIYCNQVRNCMDYDCDAQTSRCHMSNDGITWRWDRLALPGETNCSDGFDNDCNGVADCADTACASASNCLSGPTGKKLKFRYGTFNEYAAVLGENGVMDIRGTKVPNLPQINDMSNTDFIVRDSTEKVMAITLAGGSAYLLLKGDVIVQTNLEWALTNAVDEMVVKNSTGKVVAVFSSNGNLYLTGGLRQNIPNPQ